MTSDDVGLVAETKRTRAAALPPSERRAEIVAATLPLLLEHGQGVTTRQIAEAAGIAEGTIFRVFEDKGALIDAVVDAAIDPAPTEAALRAIDLDLPLEERLTEAVEIMRRRVASIFQVMSAAGRMGPPKSAGDHKAKHPELAVLADLFAPDRAALRRTPAQCAHVLRGLTLVGTHPLMIQDEPLPSDEIVSLVLDGIRGPSA